MDRLRTFRPGPGEDPYTEIPTGSDCGERRLSWPRPGRRMSYRLGTGCGEPADEELSPDSVDLLRMLPPEARRSTANNKEVNGRKLKVVLMHRDEADGGEDGGGVGGMAATVHGGYEPEGPTAANTTTTTTATTHYNDIYHTFENRNNELDERVAFFTLPRNTNVTYERVPRRNNHVSTLSVAEERARPVNVAQYCTSKVHSRSCGNLTCPRFDGKRIRGTMMQIYPEHKNKRKRTLDRLKKWAFLVAIFVGILLAVTGIIVGFLVVAPLHFKAKGCDSGYIACGNRGCVLPQQICNGAVRCHGVEPDKLCPSNKSEVIFYDGTEDDPLVYGEQITFGPPLYDLSSVSEKDLSGWVTFPSAGKNGSKYFAVNSALTFNGAQETCRDRGGHLVHVNTLREQLILEEYLKWQLKHRKPATEMLGYWIGARRQRGSHSRTCMYDQWKWVDAYGRAHASVSGFTAFVPGKPDNFYGPEECLYASTKATSDVNSYLRWDDAPCDIHGIGSMRAVCEIDLQ